MTDTSFAADSSALRPLAPLPSDAREWQRRTSTQIAAAVALLIPMAVVAVHGALAQQDDITLREMFLGPLLGGSALLFWILFLHLVVCADAIDIFGFRKPRLGLDILLGVGLAAVWFAVQFAFGATVARLLPPRPPVPQVLELIAGVSRNPWLLALWLGPVVWIGVALFEEVARAFLLRRFWLALPGSAGRWVAILVVSALVGIVHAYQGSAAIVCIGIQSIVFGWVFLRTGRIRSLIVGHAIYDSVQIAMAVVAIRQMGF